MSPVTTEPAVQVADLYGDGEYLVVLNLFTGGADCCGIVQVYAPSAAVGSWVMTERNFGESGAKLVDEGGHEVFMSGDDAFCVRVHRLRAVGTAATGVQLHG